MKLKFGVVSLLLLWVVGCAGPRAIPGSYQPHEDRAELVALAMAVHEKVNAHRVANKLPALRMDGRLSRLARRKSAAMAQGGEFAHVGFQQRVNAIGRMMQKNSVGENLAYNTHQNPAARAMAMWLDSPTHRKVMERSHFRLTGIAVAKSPEGQYYFTQLFVWPK